MEHIDKEQVDSNTKMRHTIEMYLEDDSDFVPITPAKLPAFTALSWTAFGL